MGAGLRRLGAADWPPGHASAQARANGPAARCLLGGGYCDNLPDMALTETLEARLRLSMTPGLGPILTRRLEDELGGPLAVCGASAQALGRVDGIGLKKADLIRRGIDEADTARE